MGKLKLLFLALSIFLPFVFIVLTIANFKTVRKSKKSKVRIATAIILFFGINFTIYKLMDVEKVEEEPEVIKKEEAPKKEEVEPVVENPKEGPILNGTTSKGMKIETKNGVTTIDGILIVNKTYSISSDYMPTNTHKEATAETKSCATCIEVEAYEAFYKMYEDAKKKSIKIWIQSGYRSYTYQGLLYDNYVKKDGKEKADTYSARPGHSEHQTGYAIDLNEGDSSFEKTKAGKWVSENAYKYGFIIRYPKGKTEETGYKYEPWHLRYVGVELATLLYNNGDWITLESYFGITSEY